MTREPRSKLSGEPMSEAIATLPSSLKDLPIGMWEIVDYGRKSFGLEGPSLANFIRRSIHALMDAGAKPVAGGNRPNKWRLQVQYGSNKYEVAEAVIQEWLRQGAPTPAPWTGLWFGLPSTYLPDKK